MSILLWILQALLAAVFLAHGLAYLSPPKGMREMIEESPFSMGFLRFIGVAEILAAFGLILPAWIGILPWLTPLAAAGLVPVMGGAVVYHLSQRETPQLLVTALLLAAVAFVAYARWFVAPF